MAAHNTVTDMSDEAIETVLRYMSFVPEDAPPDMRRVAEVLVQEYGAPGRGEGHFYARKAKELLGCTIA